MANNVVGSLADRAVGIVEWVLLALLFFAADVVALIGHFSGPARQLSVSGVGIGATDTAVAAVVVARI